MAMNKNSSVEAIIGSEAQQAYESILPIITKEFENVPEGSEMLQKLLQRFLNMFKDPPQTDFEFCVGKRFSLDELRIALFRPIPEQIPYYAKILIGGRNVPKDHSLRKTSSLLLTLVYLVHRKNIDFMKDFVQTDGIEALIEYLDIENLYERSQSMEVLMSFTDCDFYDWFATPTNTQDQAIHRRMITILTAVDDHQENPFIRRLLKNRNGTYPGGSLRALQLLAFWLSWIRALYTKDQRLLLSKHLLEEIQQWSDRKNNEDSVDEDEKKLAETLYEDFASKQFENYTGSESNISPHQGIQLSGIHASELISSENLSLDTSVAHIDAKSSSEIVGTPTFEVTPTIEVALKYKSEGNDFYKAEKYDLALKSYRYAMNTVTRILQSSESTSEIGSTQIQLHTNMANTLWKLWTLEESQPTIVQEIEENYFEEIKEHCEQVLFVEPHHVKAMYRLVNSYLKKEQFQTAYQMSTSFVQSLSLRNSLNESEVEDLKLFHRLKRKCLALKIYQFSTDSKHKEVEGKGDRLDFKEWNLSNIDIILLKSLLKRLQVSENVLDALTSCIEESTIVDSKSSAPRPTRRPVEPSTDDDQSFLTNQDLIQDVPVSQIKKTQKSQVKIVKMKSSDRKLITQVKALGQSLKKTYDANAIDKEVEDKLQSGFAIIRDLWSREFKLKDIYGSLIDESDILFDLNILLLAMTPPPITVGGAIISPSLSYKEWISGSEVMKMIEQLLKCERIQSILFLMKLEYQNLFLQLNQLLERLLQEEQIKSVKGNHKHISQFLSLLSS